jgi:peptide/nickel transport system substrate-binding protein
MRPTSRITSALLVTLGLVLAACGNNQASTQPSGSAAASSGPSSPAVTGGTVRIGIGGSPDSLNPGNGLLSESYTLYELVYDTPIALAADGSYQPELATDWSVADDGETWTMTIRDDVTFHDGTPLTSEDIKFSLELYRDTPDFPYLPSYPDVFDDIQAPDPTHVVIHTDGMIGNFESRMVFIYVLPKHIWETIDDPVAFENTEMIGSGAFKLVENKPDEFTRLAANRDYWGTVPNVDEVIFQTFGNADARIAALTNGDVDMITEFPATAVAALQNAANVKVAISDPVSGSLRDVFFNVVDPADCPTDEGGVCTGHAALRDVKVRQALATAVDKQQIIDAAQLGLATPGLSLVPIGLGDFFASDVSDYPFDPDAANAMLDAAGYVDKNGDGIRDCPATMDCGDSGDLTFRFNYPTDIDSAPREADQLKAMWSAIGVNIEIQGLDPDTLTSVCCPTFDYDIILWGWGVDPDPAFLLGVTLCSEVSSGFSETGYCNPDYDALYDQQGVEPDHAARVAIIHQMQQILMDDVPYIIPYYQKNVQAYRTDTFTGWDETFGPLGLEDPASLSVISQAQ